MINTNIEFHELREDDCPLLHSWLQETHVREFWDDGHRAIEQTHSYYYQREYEYGVKRFIFSIDHEAAGYIQVYDVNSSNEYYKFSKDHKKTMGIDFFMGNKKFLGKGISKFILQKFIEIYCHDADRIIVDPESKNIKAIHIYETCGFTKLSSYIIDNKQHEIMIYDK